MGVRPSQAGTTDIDTSMASLDNPHMLVQSLKLTVLIWAHDKNAMVGLRTVDVMYAEMSFMR